VQPSDLEAKTRLWLRRAPTADIVILLTAIHGELADRLERHSPIARLARQTRPIGGVPGISHIATSGHVATSRGEQ